jgi:very-short-patch-repair endonuclease
VEQELAFKLQEDQKFYQAQVEIPVTTADFYFPTQPRPLIVFVDGRVHLGKTQTIKDEELRTLLRKKGYRILELSYTGYSDSKRDEIYLQIMDSLRQT